MCLPAALIRLRPSTQPTTLAVWWALIVVVISCIGCAQLQPDFPKVLPPLDPNTDLSAQYDNADQVLLLPLGYASFLGYVTPNLAWLFLLCPLLMFLTGVGSAKTWRLFFPFGLVRCAWVRFHG